MSVESAAARPSVTAEELAALPDPDRYELVNGMQSRALIILLGSAMLPLQTQDTDAGRRRLPHYDFTVRPGWHDADPVAVAQMLRSACDELMQYFPNRRFRPIAVAFRPQGSPQMFYEGGPRGRHTTDVIRLTARSRFWCQYIYQFAHEHCHILHNADLPYPHEAGWFPESLSEMASWFVLRALSERWGREPPFPGWESFAPELHRYVEPMLHDVALPEGVTPAAWYAEHREAMRADPVNRRLNAVVAALLLPWFEEQPGHWEALTWLFHRRAPLRGRLLSFADVLAEWEYHCPPRHKPLVRRIAEAFGVGEPGGA